MILWLCLTLLCLFLQASFSMIEMAALSFNRIRLQYLVSRGVKRAIWLQKLLKRPYRLFGTVMLAVNCSLQIGSQSAREFYASLHLDPNLAPISQIFLVVIFGELAPLFAARRCSEHVIMLYTPLIYWAYRALSPIIWIISLLIKGIYRITGRSSSGIELSHEQLQKLLESPDEDGADFNFVVTNVLALRNQSVRPFIYRLPNLEVLPESALVREVREKLKGTSQSFIPLYDKRVSNLVAVVPLERLAKAQDDDRAIDYSKKPLFLSANTSLTTALELMAKSSRLVAIVMNEKKGALGVLPIESLFERMFCQEGRCVGKRKGRVAPVIERSVAGNVRIADFNREYGTQLPEGRAETLAQLILNHLEGPASPGDHIAIGQLALEAEEIGLTGIKTVRIKSLTT